MLERLKMTPESVRDLRAPHPSWARFLKLLHGIGFPELFAALCARHPKRGPDVPVEKRREALTSSGILWTWHKRGKFWSMRERMPERAPKKCGLGLDITIDARVECTLNFATPFGHLGYNFPRLERHARRVTEPDYQPKRKNPAPRIGHYDELPVILADCMSVYEAIVQAVLLEDWEVP